MTQKFGILAYPAKHSLSPAMHNAAFKHLGIDAEYEVFEVKGQSFKKFMRELRDSGIQGLSVSLPYKERVLPFLDVIDEDARKIGAVNTIVNRDGLLYGYNTDFLGAIRAIKEVCDLKDKSVIIIGAGGAARAIAYGMLREGANVGVYNRKKPRAVKIAIDFAEIFGNFIHGFGFDDTLFRGDILVHASSIWHTGGIKDLTCPFFTFGNYVKPFHLVMEISYNYYHDPNMLWQTPMTEAAEYEKKPCITGDKMLLYQAMEQFKIWTAREAPMEVMRKALLGKAAEFANTTPWA